MTDTARKADLAKVIGAQGDRAGSEGNMTHDRDSFPPLRLKCWYFYNIQL